VDGKGFVGSRDARGQSLVEFALALSVLLLLLLGLADFGRAPARFIGGFFPAVAPRTMRRVRPRCLFPGDIHDRYEPVKETGATQMSEEERDDHA
jgi:hypothetical protein